MKSLRKHKIVMILLSMMLITTDICSYTVYATDPGSSVTDPGTDNPGSDTIDPAPDPTPTPDPDPNPGDGETGDGNTGETTPPGGETGGGEVEEPEYIPSSVNTLKDLAVEGFDLTPNFSNSEEEYELEVPANTTKITITASREDSKSSVSGTGTFDVTWEVGSYDFKVTCRAENGSTRTFVIHLTVSSEPYLDTASGGQTLWFVIKGLKDLIPPEDFVMAEGSYEGEKITTFTNDNFPFSLVYLQNDNKKQDWYCYQDGVVTGVFRTLIFNKTKYYYAGINDANKKQSGYSYSDLNVSGEQLNGWKVNKEKTKIMLYLYDSMGNSDYYIYDTDDLTLQRRREYEVTETKENRSFLKSPVTITAIIIVVIAAIFGAIILKDGKKNGVTIKKKKDKEKEYDETKFDHTVELVRTGKVKIFADAPQTEIEKTKEFNLADLKVKEPSEKFEEPIVETEVVEEKDSSAVEEMKAEEPKKEKKKSFFKKKEKEVKEEAKVEDVVLQEDSTMQEVKVEESKTEEVKIEEPKKEKKKGFFFKKNEKEVKEEAKVEDVVLQEDSTMQEVKVEESKTEEVKIEEPKKEKKKGFFFKKKEKETKEIEEIEEIKDILPIIEVKEDVKKERAPIPEMDEEEAIREIQKYIDNLFYLDEK